VSTGGPEQIGWIELHSLPMQKHHPKVAPSPNGRGDGDWRVANPENGARRELSCANSRN
jgi:hypothetical protein